MPDKDSPLVGLLIFLLLMVIKAVISKIKASISYINESEVRKKAEQEDADSKALLELLLRPEEYIFAIDIVVTTLSVLFGILYFEYLHMPVLVFWDRVSGHTVIAVALEVLTVFCLIIMVSLFGSLVPKKLARRNAEKRAYRTVNLMKGLVRMLRPLTFCMQVVMNGVIRLLGIKPSELIDNVTEEGIMSMVNEGHEQGVLEANEAQMISNIIEFDEKEVCDIMTHRKKIVAISSELSIEEALRFMLDHNFSRFPLYEGDLDNITGILHIRDITKEVVENKETQRSLKELSRRPHFVPETQKIDILFNDMKKHKIHMAVAVDEYGQTSGIVAFEDVIEEIVGNILDEHDIDEKNIIRQANGNYIAKGMAELKEIEKVLGITMYNDTVDTLNGFLICRLNRVPEDGEKMSIKFGGYIFDVLEISNRTIKFVRIRNEKTT